MSHNVKIDMNVKDLTALSKAAAALGAELKIGQTTFASFAGQRSKCDHAIKIPGSSYEVGLLKMGDGSYQLQCDFWSSGGLTGALGESGNKLKQQYTLALARKHYGATFRMTTFTKEDGTIIVDAEN